MAESMVSLAVEHIESITKKETNSMLCCFGSKATAVCQDLKKIKKLVVDVLQKDELRNSEQVRPLLDQLRRIAYEAEDVVDIYISETESGLSIMASLSLGLVNYPRMCQALKKLHRLCKQVQEVELRLSKYRERSTMISKVPVTSPTTEMRSSAEEGQQQANDDCVVGIEEDVKRLVMMLVAGEKDHNHNECQDHGDTYIQPNVLAIVGMGGSGKTILARSIYNHRNVQKHFKSHTWWFPSIKGQSASDVMSEILRKTAVSTNNPRLVVLDDVWDWGFLQTLLRNLIQFSFGAENTKIVFTSRQHLQPFQAPSLKWHFHETQLLGEANSWVLFNKFSTSHGKELAKEYKGLAMEMLKKCDGLPLAIVALSSFLKTKDTIQEWENVFSQLVGIDGLHLYRPVNEKLALSFDYLPCFLKPLFLYFGLFCKDSTISSEKLKRMWIAEGFVATQCVDEETLEDAANRLLQQLIENTMVQVVKSTSAGKPKTLRVHDIMRDLCIIKAQEQDLFTVYPGKISHRNSRRAAINMSKWSALPLDNSHLRSLLLFRPRDNKNASVGNQQANLNLTLVCEKFKLLRVLDIKGIKASDVAMPKEIGNLIHLRYLRIRSTNIEELPKSIGELRELLTLDYRNVSADHNGIRLPNVLWKLKHLRHLYLPYETNDSKDFKFHTMKDLQTLWGVRGGNWMCKSMRRMSLNLQKLSIQGIARLRQINSLFESPMIMTQDHLHSLALDWYGFELDWYGFEALCRKKNLQELRLTGNAPDSSMPLQFPFNIGKLELCFTQLEKRQSMQALANLNNLKFLRLDKDSYMGREWIIDGEKAFPKLEELKLCNLQKLEKWAIISNRGTMQCLKKLSIVSCTKLKCLPVGLKSINTLETLKIRRMPTIFNCRLLEKKDSKGNKGEDFHIIENIHNRDIRDSCTPLFS